MKYELHLHSMDQFDSQNDPADVCARLKETGCEAFALTQHGVLSNIYPMKDAADAAGLKFIPGIETYFGTDDDLRKNRHLILLSKDFEGFKAISMAVSESSNKQGFSVMTPEILKKYFAKGKAGHGHVIATSACINGVVAYVLRRNEEAEREIEKIRKRQASVGFDESAYASVSENVKEIEKEIADITEKRDRAKAAAGAKLGKRRKYVDSLLKEGDSSYEDAAAELAADMKKVEEAKEEFERLKKERAKLTKKLGAFRTELKAHADKKARYDAFEANIAKLEKQIYTEEELDRKALETAKWFDTVFGEGLAEPHFYMEIQNHRLQMEKDIYPKIVEIARKGHLPLVATNDVHIVRNSYEELLKRATMQALRFGKWEGIREGDEQLYIKTDEEMDSILLELFPEDVVREAVANTKAIADRCNVVFETGSHYPKFPSEDGKSADEVIDEEIQRGIRWRFPNGMPPGYRERLDYELSIIKQMGYVDYHLIVKDFLEYGRALAPVPTEKLAEAPLTIKEAKAWVKENGWTGGFSIGPGRGSAVGSLVCYLLGITSLDPIKYGLLFERFLNPERVSMPETVGQSL